MDGGGCASVLAGVTKGGVGFVLSDSLTLYLVQVEAGADSRGRAGGVCGREGRDGDRTEREGGSKGGREGGARKDLILVSRLRPGCPLSAELVLGVVLVQQFDVCEGKVAALAFTFALPLAVDVDFGHLHHVAHLEEARERGRDRLLVK